MYIPKHKHGYEEESGAVRFIYMVLLQLSVCFPVNRGCGKVLRSISPAPFNARRRSGVMRSSRCFCTASVSSSHPAMKVIPTSPERRRDRHIKDLRVSELN